MPDSGPELGVDLYDLLRAARRNFPTVVNEYHAALANVDAAAGMQHALHRPDFFGFPGVERYWPEALDGLRRALAETATSLELTGEALELAVSAYSQTDAAAAAELRRLIDAKGIPHANQLH
jgi:hypothetical protein